MFSSIFTPGNPHEPQAVLCLLLKWCVESLLEFHLKTLQSNRKRSKPEEFVTRKIFPCTQRDPSGNQIWLESLHFFSMIERHYKKKNLHLQKVWGFPRKSPSISWMIFPFFSQKPPFFPCFPIVTSMISAQPTSQITSTPQSSSGSLRTSPGLRRHCQLLVGFKTHHWKSRINGLV